MHLSDSAWEGSQHISDRARWGGSNNNIRDSAWGRGVKTYVTMHGGGGEYAHTFTPRQDEFNDSFNFRHLIIHFLYIK